MTDMDFAKKVVQGDVLSAARLIRCLEDEVDGAAEELEALYVKTGRAHVVGITGAPGVGKSTVLGCLIGSFRRRGMTVGVVAVDPSSPFSGGAILGDRVRMQAYGLDREVFIRSLASRGWKGGLSRATVSTVHVMDAMGKDIIFVEAVGSGQADVDIALISDTVLLVLNPGAGDEVQMMKAGILETADVFVVNKSDLAGADQLRQGLVSMLAMSARSSAKDEWQRTIVMAEAICDKGTEDMAEAILRHKELLSGSGEMQKRREARARLELAWAVEDYLKKHIAGMDPEQLARTVSSLAQRKTSPRSVVSEIVARMSSGGSGGFFADRITKDA
jgi:LAO/AO transport system kinase